MLRPATPLSVMYGVAFVLLLLSTLSTPVIKSIPLGKLKGVSYGVFGYCNASTCTPATLGYSADQPSSSDSEYPVPASVRHSLSSILVVHPVACFMTLICFIMAIGAHFRTPSHSSKYLLTLLILSFPTLLVALLAFLVDILLFIPHMGWGGWIVLVATLIIMACALLTCAMRRTIVSRKARERRLEENKDMNGEAFYSQQFAERQQYQQAEMQRMAVAQQEEQLARADSPPPLSSTTAVNTDSPSNKFPQSATYEYDQSRPGIGGDGARSVGRQNTFGDQSLNGSYGPNESMRRDPSGTRSGQRTPRRSQDSQRSGGPPPFYGPRGRGGYPPRGGPMRGMYPPPPGGYPPRGAFRGGPRGPPPPGWNGGAMGPMMAGAGAGMAAGAMMGRGGRGRGPLPDYDRRYYGPPPAGDGYGPGPAPYDEMGAYGQGQPPGPAGAPGYHAYGMPDETAYAYDPRAISPGYGSGQGTPRGRVSPPPLPHMEDDAPIGMAVEMPANHGSIVQGSGAYGYNNGNGFDAHDQASQPSPISRGLADQQGSGDYPPMSPWAADEPVELGSRSPPTQHSQPNHSVDGAIAELPTVRQSIEPVQTRARSNTGTRSRTSSDNYYEDVDPRFADDAPPLPAPEPATNTTQPPASLLPGGSAAYAPSASTPFYTPQDELAHPAYPSEPTSPYAEDSLPAGARSPPESDASDYTSISQRGINPAWRPGPGEYPSARPTHSWRAPPPTAGVLDENPDFAVPGAGPGRSSRARGMSAASSGGQGGPYPAGSPYPGAI